MILVLGSIHHAWARGRQETGVIVEDPHEYYTVGISLFRGINLPGEYAYLEKSVPLLLFEQLAECTVHYFDPAQEEAYKRYMVSKGTERIDKELEEQYAQLDALLFKGTDKDEFQQKIEDTIDGLMKSKETLLNTSLDTITAIESKPILLKDYSEQQRLFPKPLVSNKVTAEENGLNLLLYGSVEEIEGFFILSLYAYSSIEDRIMVSSEFVATGDTVREKVVEFSNAVKTVVLGREWANIVIEAEPRDARIAMDGVFQGSGRVVKELLEPGEYSLTISYPGFETQEHSIRLFPKETGEFTFQLAETPVIVRSLSTYPPGADVYVASKWVGKTPLFLHDLQENTLLSLTREGYREYGISRFPDDQLEIRVRLSPAEFDWNDYIDERRDKVYGSLSLFILSLPFPLVFYNLSQEYATGFYMAAEERNTLETERMFNRTAFYYHSYVGSFFLSASLFINSIVHLVQYIETTRVE